MQIDVIFGLVVLLFSVILHEVAHGYAALYLGDPTAKLQGRLTLNPVSHIDPLGSLIVPGLLLLTHSPILIGYAKPVPYNPYNLQGRHAEGAVAFAGPATNIALALLFGLLIRFASAQLGPELVGAFAIICYINMLLALFNLIPLPPLDGSKVLGTLLGMLSPELERGYGSFLINFQRLGMLPMLVVVLLVFYVLAPYFGALLQGLFVLLTGAVL